MAKTKLMQFEESLLREAREYVREEKRNGVTGMSKDCLANMLASRMGKYSHEDGAPRGTNAKWMFWGMVSDLCAIDPILHRFTY